MRNIDVSKNLANHSLDELVITLVAVEKTKTNYLKQTCLSDCNRASVKSFFEVAIKGAEDAFCDRMDKMAVPILDLMMYSTGFKTNL